ncbi:MAG TPA: TonB-dependent receptor [Terriglobia bacterium]|nr:TonB-dependent receptor [Terriglobia bacterium]
MKRVIALRILALEILLLVGGSTGILLSQNANTGEIRGLVTDPSGAVVPGVEVTFTNVLTGVSTRTTTNASGIYDAPTLLSGTYSITFSQNGFRTFIRNGITLGVQVVEVNATLSVGSVSQEVTVTAATPLVQTATSESSASLSAKEVYDLPNVSMQWYSYTNLLPGVAPGAINAFGGTNTSVNGSAPYTSNWLVNGGTAMWSADNNNPDVVNDTPMQSIAEIKAETNNYSAAFGNGSSVFNVITKTGTNEWHGSLFEYVQNTSLNARNFFEPSTSPYHWNEFGGTLGGPIKHNKAFFFFSYQDMRQVEYSPGLYTVPTAAEEAGDFSSSVYPTVYDPASLVNGVRSPLPNNTIPPSEISPFAAAAQQYFPKPNLPGLYNNYFDNVIFPNTDEWIGGSTQYHFSAANQLSLALNFSKSFLPEPNAFPTENYVDNYLEQQDVLTDSWTIKPSMVNVAHFTYLRTHEHCLPANASTNYPSQLGELNPMANLFPNITINGAISTYIGGGVTCVMGQGTYGPSDVLTIVKGKHILNMGGEFDRLYNNFNGWSANTTANFTFSGSMTANPADPTSTGLGYADFLYGLPETWSVTEYPTMGWRSWQGSAFIEDDYKIRKDLTLNLGLRYGMLGGFGEAHNRLSNFDPNIINPATNTPGALWYAGQDGRTTTEASNYHGFQPRVGFAWSPRDNWAVRGAFGIFDQVWAGANYSGAMGQGWDPTGFETSPDLYTPIFSVSPPTATMLADYPTLTQGPAPALVPTAATRTASLLNGQSIGYYPYRAPIPYIQQAHVDIQHQLPDGIFVDVGYAWTRGIHLPWFANFDQVPENLLGPGNALLQEPYPQYTGLAGNFYDGVSNYNALKITVKRKFSNSLLFTVNYTWSKAEDTETVSNWAGGDSGLVQYSYNPMADYGLGNMDMPNIFNAQAIYQLPFGSGKRFANRGGILNGVIGGWQLSSILWLHSGSPYTPTMGTANLSGSLQNYWYPNRIASGTVPSPSINEWFNPAAFVEPAPYTFGNSGRNVLFGPSYKDLDLSLSKSFRISKLGEGGQFQIRADATDLLNSPNFGFPNSSIGTFGVGVISTANTNRLIQVGARLSF